MIARICMRHACTIQPRRSIQLFSFNAQRFFFDHSSLSCVIMSGSTNTIPTSLYRKASGFIRSGYFKLSNSLPSVTALLLLQIQLCFAHCLSKITGTGGQKQSIKGQYCQLQRQRQELHQQSIMALHFLNPLYTAKFITKKCIYWLLSFAIFLVDIVAKLLNVYQEMQDFVTGNRVIQTNHKNGNEQQQQQQHQHHQHHQHHHHQLHFYKNRNIKDEAGNNSTLTSTTTTETLPNNVIMQKTEHSRITISKQPNNDNTKSSDMKTPKSQFNRRHHHHGSLRHSTARPNLINSVERVSDDFFHHQSNRKTAAQQQQQQQQHEMFRDANITTRHTSAHNGCDLSYCNECSESNRKSDDSRAVPTSTKEGQDEFFEIQGFPSRDRATCTLSCCCSSSSASASKSSAFHCCSNNKTIGVTSSTKEVRQEPYRSWTSRDGCCRRRGCCDKKDWLCRLRNYFEKKKRRVYTTNVYYH